MTPKEEWEFKKPAVYRFLSESSVWELGEMHRMIAEELQFRETCKKLIHKKVKEYERKDFGKWIKNQLSQ